MKLYFGPHPEWERLTEERGPAAEGVPGKRPVFQALSIQAGGRGFSQARCSHTCACISNKPPMDS